MIEASPLTYEDLAAAVAGGAAAIRSVTRLQPAGGAGDKVFPPTYATGDKATTRYAFEDRRIDGADVKTVLLDSVASQANRMEEAMFLAWEDGTLTFPVIGVDFSKEEGLGDLDRITTLHAPHRIADALLRDAVDEAGTRFRDTLAGRAYTDASSRNATAIFRYCPTALVFGVWDSTGPRGGSGNKIQRALVSEIVGIGAVAGKKTASRLDPVGIQGNVPVFHRKDDRDDWTIRESEALVEKGGKPTLFSRKGSEGKGKPSAINHSNIAPSIDELAGGVTIDHAVQTTVLSLVALRRLRFVTNVAGEPVSDEARQLAERAARTALAALALAGVAALRNDGFHLRSRAQLVPDPGGPLIVEIVPTQGGDGTRHSLTADGAAALLRKAAARASEAGMGWEREPAKLRPARKLADLIRESRRLAARGEGQETEGTPG